ncbi:MAG: hypothetical protein KatS3mg003_0247 [Candidatus Nitrosocaldaceae archaeon]|nr:MAG: hypothetical protein KatS3mg003_0247 [Candidatus Nitrosocaldaceae archaeon]
MPKYPFIFLVLLLTINYAHALELELNQKVFTPNDRLVIFGTSIPKDSLIISLFNPTGNLIYRTQLDVGANGEFASILLRWPEPDEDKFRVGTYTLIVTSSINPDSSVSEALVYQLQAEKPVKDTSIQIEQQLGLDLSIPSTANIDKEIPILAHVSLNDAPLIGLEAIEANIIYPDNKVLTINNFTAIGDGLYETRFTSNITGYHTIILNVKHQELSISKASIVDVVKGQNDQLQELATKIDSLNIKITNNTNNINNNVNAIKESIDDMTSAIGQLTSLLLPIVGMIAIIVALQATILAKRK